MQFLGILGGFKTRQKQFFAYFWSQKQTFGEKLVFIGKIGDFSPIFFPDFSIPISFPVPPKSDFSLKNRQKSAIFLSMDISYLKNNN